MQITGPAEARKGFSQQLVDELSLMLAAADIDENTVSLEVKRVSLGDPEDAGLHVTFYGDHDVTFALQLDGSEKNYTCTLHSHSLDPEDAGEELQRRLHRAAKAREPATPSGGQKPHNHMNGGSAMPITATGPSRTRTAPPNGHDAHDSALPQHAPRAAPRTVPALGFSNREKDVRAFLKTLWDEYPSGEVACDTVRDELVTLTESKAPYRILNTLEKKGWLTRGGDRYKLLPFNQRPVATVVPKRTPQKYDGAALPDDHPVSSRLAKLGQVVSYHAAKVSVIETKKRRLAALNASRTELDATINALELEIHEDEAGLPSDEHLSAIDDVIRKLGNYVPQQPETDAP